MSGQRFLELISILLPIEWNDNNIDHNDKKRNKNKQYAIQLSKYSSEKSFMSMQQLISEGQKKACIILEPSMVYFFSAREFKPGHEVKQNIGNNTKCSPYHLNYNEMYDKEFLHYLKTKIYYN